MRKVNLSLNQLAEFSWATEKGKKRIISQQINPNPVLIPWYQLTKARIRKSLELKGDLGPVYEGIKTLMNRIPTNSRQTNDKRVSIQALERFIQIKLPDILKNIDYEIVKPKSKALFISDVEIIVAPDIIIRGIIDGKPVLGGLKIHISKTKPFDQTKSVYISSTIYRFLKEVVATDDDVVMPELCFSLDVFGDRIMSAPQKPEDLYPILEKICEEVKTLWPAA